eukprot:TRINITY_DN16630_c0_g1_i1.p1 TRINITY_DN16630_c0_g1~~TRINITY_DN16630_c0_g1_i1.p1  ORF type:complete len:248 (-),score=51.85 TRINITY_DN16630_c0_g1_i1:226-969(-)
MKTFSCIAALCSISFVRLASCASFNDDVTNKFGLKFLEENKKKEGVITLPSGLQYKVLQAGTGDRSPRADTICEVAWVAWTAEKFPDGQKYEDTSTATEEIKFAPSDEGKNVPLGQREALMMMVEGDEWELYIPSSLAFGQREKKGSEGFAQGGDVMVYRTKLVRIDGTKKDTVPVLRCDVTTLEGCNDKQKAFVTKQTEKGMDKGEKELDRLRLMGNKDLGGDARIWLDQRIALLERILHKWKEEL